MSDADLVARVMAAAWSGDVDQLRMLLDKNPALVNCVGDAEGARPVHYAAAKSLPALMLLLERGADPKVTGNDGNALHLAVWFENLATVQYLLELGVTPNGTAEVGETPLHFAALRGYDAIGELLLLHGADANIKTTHGHTDMFSTSPPVVGETPLHLAAAAGHASFVRLLLKHGADRNISARDGQLAVHWAARHRHDELIAVLK